MIVYVSVNVHHIETEFGLEISHLIMSHLPVKIVNSEIQNIPWNKIWRFRKSDLTLLDSNLTSFYLYRKCCVLIQVIVSLPVKLYSIRTLASTATSPYPSLRPPVPRGQWGQAQTPPSTHLSFPSPVMTTPALLWVISVDLQLAKNQDPPQVPLTSLEKNP